MCELFFYLCFGPQSLHCWHLPWCLGQPWLSTAPLPGGPGVHQIQSPVRRKIQVESRNHGKSLGRELDIRKDYEALTGLGQTIYKISVGIKGW